MALAIGVHERISRAPSGALEGNVLKIYMNIMSKNSSHHTCVGLHSITAKLPSTNDRHTQASEGHHK